MQSICTSPVRHLDTASLQSPTVQPAGFSVPPTPSYMITCRCCRVVNARQHTATSWSGTWSSLSLVVLVVFRLPNSTRLAELQHSDRCQSTTVTPTPPLPAHHLPAITSLGTRDVRRRPERSADGHGQTVTALRDRCPSMARVRRHQTNRVLSGSPLGSNQPRRRRRRSRRQRDVQMS